MSLPHAGEEIRQNQLRVWPGVAAVALQWSLRFGLPVIAPETLMYAVLGGLAGGLAVLIWWVFFSRAAHFERWGALVLIAAAVVATPRILDKSIATGMMGMMFPIYVIPVLSLALVAGAVAGRHLTAGPRRATLAACILAGCGVFALLRTGGITGEGASDLAWRWASTPEEHLLARTVVEPPPAAPKVPAITAPPAEPAARPAAAKTLPAPRTEVPVEAGWPGFRGPQRDDVVRGVRIRTDWAASPPVELWRRAVGPGWSSIAVQDGVVYTQEQRGDFEVVASYKAASGEPVWTHRDATRFWESNAGAGPRATPTVSGGRIYTFGATGILNALNAADGAVIWTRNVAADTGVKTPMWGFSSSPLVLEDAVIIAAASHLAAYETATGVPRWSISTGAMSYSSPHLLTIGNVAQVLLLSDTGVTSVAPVDGRVLWKHAWPGFTLLQPALTADGNVLITTSSAAGGTGTRRLAVAQGPAGWSAEERWTSRGLKPYFSDLVVHNGHAFGFDGSILSCIDLQDGSRKWKGGRYGQGQMLLIADQDLLLVLSEDGELALVAASPAQFSEVARFRALEGKTWNHPVLSGNLLFVRNGQEMVAFRLSRAGA